VATLLSVDKLPEITGRLGRILDDLTNEIIALAACDLCPDGQHGLTIETMGKSLDVVHECFNALNIAARCFGQELLE